MSFHTYIRSAPRPGAEQPERGAAPPNPAQGDPRPDLRSDPRFGPGNGSPGSAAMAPAASEPRGEGLLLPAYLESLALVERMHRLLLDVIKDEFERLGILNVNAVQALLLFNIGANEVTAGELKSRGYYQGSNVSYNLKKLVELGYMFHSRCEIDRRSVRVSLTEQGLELRRIVGELFARHAEGMAGRRVIGLAELDAVNASLRRVERFWSEQIRYIY